MRLWAPTCLVLLLALAAPREAAAGACPTCTSHADCAAGPPGSVCVRHFQDVGCGVERQICCPGQGCALKGGQPSCLGVSCELVEAPDAGQPDSGGAPAPDAAPGADAAPPGDAAPAGDSGLPAVDGGAGDAEGQDATAPRPDMGINTGGGGGASSRTERQSDCACTAAEGRGGAGSAAAAALLLLLAMRRARR